MTDQTSLVERASIDSSSRSQTVVGALSCLYRTLWNRGDTRPDSHDPPDFLHAPLVQTYPALPRPTSHVLSLDVETATGHPRRRLIGK